MSAVAEEVRRVRDRRGEVDRRRDDVGGERQPDGGRQERDVSLRELQAAKKHGTATPAGDGCWKYEYDGVVYVTDATQKRVITTYRAEPVPAPRELGDFARLSL